MIDTQTVTDGLTRKIGPLPVWGWGGIVIGGLLVYKLATGKGASSPFVQPVSGGTPFDYDAVGANGGASGSSGTPAGTVDPLPLPIPATDPNFAPNALPPLPSLPGLTTPRTPLVQATGDRIGTVSTTRTPLAGIAPVATYSPDRSAPTGSRTFGDTSGAPPVLGLPIARAVSIDDARTYAAATWGAAAPEAPSFPVPVPGTVSPPVLPPLLAVQGDTRARVDPRGWATAAAARARRGVIPTTAPGVVRLDRLRERIRPTTD